MLRMSRSDGLRVWHAARDYADQVTEFCESLPRSAPTGLRGQLSRAANAVPDNIAEGAGRATRGEKLKSFRTARGELEESQSQLRSCRKKALTDDPTYFRLWNRAVAVGKMLASLIAGLERDG